MRYSPWFIALIALAGCDDGGERFRYGYAFNWGPASNTLFVVTDGEVEGDWFLCDDADCERFDRDAFRLEPGGRVLGLRLSSRRNDPDLTFCIVGAVGRWSYDAGVLTLTLLGGEGAKVRVGTMGSRTVWTVRADDGDLESLLVVRRPLETGTAACGSPRVVQVGGEVPPPTLDGP